MSRIFAPLNASDDQMANMASQGFTEELLVVNVRNVGRLPVDVESVDAYFGSGWGISEPGRENRPLPHRLEPGSSESWHVPMEYLQRMLAIRKVPSEEVFMVVGFGTGKSLKTKERFLIRADDS